MAIYYQKEELLARFMSRWTFTAFDSNLITIDTHNKFYSGEIEREAIGVVGWVTVGVSSPNLISGLFVKPQHRQQGIATMLLHLAEQQIKINGCTISHLQVENKNTIAKRLYDKMGYKVIEMKFPADTYIKYLR